MKSWIKDVVVEIGGSPISTPSSPIIEPVPTVVAISYADWDSGSFTETLDNGATLAYTVENDTEGRPIKVTRPDGSEVEVAW